MHKISCIVIEDEPLAVKVIAGYISRLPFLELTGTFKDAILATDYLRNNRPDLIFLDIHLPRLKGLTFLKSLTNPPSIIITSAYQEYAIEGFEQNVTDYLLKPFDFERFLSAVNKVKPDHKISRRDVQEVREYFFITVQKKKVKIQFSDILFIESQREYIRLVTSNNEYRTKMGTNEIESILPSSDFTRIHRSFIISISKVDGYTADQVEIRGASLPIGKSFRDVINKF